MKGGARQWLLSRKWLSGPDSLGWGTSMAFHLFGLQCPTHLSPSAIMKGQGDCFKTQHVLISIFCPITFSRLYYFEFKLYLWIQIQSIIFSPLTFLTQNQETQKHQSHLKVHRTPKLWRLRDSRKSHRLRKGRGLYAVSILITVECTQSVLTSFLSVSWISCCLLDFETHSLSTAPSLSKLLNVSVGKRHHYLRYSKIEILSFSTFFHLLVSFFLWNRPVPVIIPSVKFPPTLPFHHLLSAP